jgi:hypothetical protein
MPWSMPMPATLVAVRVGGIGEGVQLICQAAFLQGFVLAPSCF